MTTGGTLLGLMVITSGVWLLDSAVQNRPPIKTLETIIKSPSSALSAVKSAKGTAYAVPTGTSESTTGSTAATSVQAAEAIAYARSKIGLPYKYGATGPNAYDCSGLVQASYKAAGVSLPRTTVGQILVGSPVSKAKLVPGDLVFPDPGHVQIYTGNGMVVEAPRTGEKVREVAMWGFFTARHLPLASGGGTVTA
jgi:cell wall-associated NlpC family hydrolase